MSYFLACIFCATALGPAAVLIVVAIARDLLRLHFINDTKALGFCLNKSGKSCSRHEATLFEYLYFE
jgi:hypothetical protein